MKLTTWYLTGRAENDPAGLEGAGRSSERPAGRYTTKRTREEMSRLKVHRDDAQQAV